MAEGILFDIQRFSVNDGPGIRTTAFLKGCPLACRWCHNPEGRSRRIQVRFFAKKCFGCGACERWTGTVPASLAGREAGEKEEAAAEFCPGGALTISGRRYTPEELVEILERDRDFYGERGGVTFSGGEPAMQPEFLEEALFLCRERGLNTALDTCGYAPRSVYERVLPLCDLVLYDIKSPDPEIHLRWTGKDNRLILENFRFAASSGVPVWVRVPVIREVNADLRSMEAIAGLLAPYRQAVGKVTLMPYHNFGNVKYETLGLKASAFTEPPEEEMRAFEQIFQQRGFVTGP